MPKLAVINKTKPRKKDLWFIQPNRVQTTFIGRFSTFCRIGQGFRKGLNIKYIFSSKKMYTFLTTLLILDNSPMGHRTWSKLHLFSFRASVWRSQENTTEQEAVAPKLCLVDSAHSASLVWNTTGTWQSRKSQTVVIWVLLCNTDLWFTTTQARWTPD